MHRLIAIVFVSVLIVGSVTPPAHAGHRTATNVALGLASFAVFSQLIAPALYPRPVYATPVYVPGPPSYVIYAPQPQLVVVPPSSPTPLPSVVQYPHGRYELRGDGVTAAYQWVWIPNPPPAPPAKYQQPSAPPAAAPPTLDAVFCRTLQAHGEVRQDTARDSPGVR
jgi:hypothetical protein